MAETDLPPWSPHVCCWGNNRSCVSGPSGQLLTRRRHWPHKKYPLQIVGAPLQVLAATIHTKPALEDGMKYCFLVAFVSAALLFADESWAQQLEYIGKPVRGIPVSSAVKVGKFVFVSGTPGYDKGKLAVGDFTAQMKQVMENISSTLKASGTGMERVVKTNVLLMRAADFDEMNRIYSSYFPEGKYPARTTVVVAGLPHPDFLLEIECEAVLE